MQIQAPEVELLHLGNWYGAHRRLLQLQMLMFMQILEQMDLQTKTGLIIPV